MAFLTDLLVSDATKPHELAPHGVPAWWDWCKGPVVQSGTAPPPTYTYGIPWGELYAPVGGNPQPGALVELRSMNAYLLSASSGRWSPWVETERLRLKGAQYPEPFNGPASATVLDYSVPDSLKCAPAPDKTFHFYPGGRRPLNPADLADVVTVVWARLVPGSFDPAAASPQIIASVGFDYWTTPTLNYPTAKGAFQGRFKLVTPWWQLFTGGTIRAPHPNPPPVPVAAAAAPAVP